MNARPNRLCQGTTKSGDPCGATAAKGSLYCFLHDPEREQERREWARKGGKASSTQRRLKRLIRNAEELDAGDLGRLLSGAMLLLLEHKLVAADVSALASAAKALNAIRTTIDLEQRIEALEAAQRSRESRSRMIG